MLPSTNEAQGYHWTQWKCTIHPAVCNFEKGYVLCQGGQLAACHSAFSGLRKHSGKIIKSEISSNLSK